MAEKKKKPKKRPTNKKKGLVRGAEAKKGKKEREEKTKKPRKIAEIRPGYLVKVVHLSPDGQRNFTTEGVVLRVRGKGNSRTFTVRRVVEGVGVEKVFNLASPALRELTVIKKDRVRRSRLYYLRSRS